MNGVHTDEATGIIPIPALDLQHGRMLQPIRNP